MSLNHTPRIAAEMLATADALRHVQRVVSQLVNADHPAIVCQPETTIVLTQGPQVADALETLGQRIDIQK